MLSNSRPLKINLIERCVYGLSRVCSGSPSIFQRIRPFSTGGSFRTMNGCEVSSFMSAGRKACLVALEVTAVKPKRGGGFKVDTVPAGSAAGATARTVPATQRPCCTFSPRGRPRGGVARGGRPLGVSH